VKEKYTTDEAIGTKDRRRKDRKKGRKK